MPQLLPPSASDLPPHPDETVRTGRNTTVWECMLTWPETSWCCDRFSMMPRMPPLPERYWLPLSRRPPLPPEEMGRLLRPLPIMLSAESLIGRSLSCTAAQK